jgi:serine/threonine protein kinase
MPFVQSGTLTGLLQGKPLSLSQICRIITQVGDALDYAHSHHIIHRDVKPSNILVDERGNCLLTDFGIAKIIEGTAQFTHTGGIIGTPAYMSPEQGLGEKVDHRSDIYALGVILYELATGRVPYTAETPMAVMVKHINDPLPLPHQLNSTLPEAVERVILKALAKQAADRYGTMRDMVRALEKAIPASTPLDTALNDKATTSTPTGATEAPGQVVVEATIASTTQKQYPSRSFWVDSAIIGGAILALTILIVFILDSKRVSQTAEAATPLPTVTLNTATVVDIAAVVPETPTPPTHIQIEKSPTVTLMPILRSADVTVAIPDIPTVTSIPPSSSVDKTPAPISTAIVDADQTVYDNFNDPDNDGSFNGDKWYLDNTDGVCEVYQREGILTFSMNNISSQTGKGCMLQGPKEVKGNRLELFEVKIKISEDFKGRNAKTNMVMGGDGFTGGGWMECGLDALPNRINAYFAVKTHGGKIGEFDETYPVEYNRWYTFRYEVDPSTMKVSCFVDDTLVGAVIPKDASRLKNSIFGRYIQTYVEAGDSATTFIDDVRSIP